VTPNHPSPVQWLRYALGGRLPERLREWVWHDLTDPDWRVRQLLRVVVQAALPCLVLLLLPGPWTVRALAIALVLIGALGVSALFADELRDRRLRQHGVDPGGPPPPAAPDGAA